MDTGTPNGAATPVPDKPEGAIRMVLDFTPATKSLALYGPVADRMLCYAMLKMGEKSIDEHHAAQSRKAILPAGGFREFLRTRGH